MSDKITLSFINFSPIGPKTLQSFYFSIECQFQKQLYKSPVIYGGSPICDEKTSNSFWSIQLDKKQHEVKCKIITVSQNLQTYQQLAQCILSTQYQSSEQQVLFYCNNKKIAELTYVIHPYQKQTLYPAFSTVPSTMYSPVNHSSTFLKQGQKQPHDIQNSQDQENHRFHLQPTPYNSLHNSAIHLKNFTQFMQPHSLDKLNQSSIQHRHPYIADDSFIGHNYYVEQLQRQQSASTQREQTSLQKWIKKIQSLSQYDLATNLNTLQVECLVNQSHDKNYHDEGKPQSFKLNLQTLKLNNQLDPNLTVKSLSINVLNDHSQSQSQKEKQSIFNCSFSQPQKSQPQVPLKQIKFKSLMTEIPNDKNIQIEIFLQNKQNKLDPTVVSGIFVKEKFIDQEKLPLFINDESLFACLDYKVKVIQNASVQCLPPLPDLQQDENNCQNKPSQRQINFSPQNRYNVSPQNKLSKSNNIRQRKFNTIFLKRQTVLKTKKYSYDQAQFENNQSPTPQSPQSSNIQFSPMQRNTSGSQSFHLPRSNTEEMPYFQLESDSPQKSTGRNKNVRQNQFTLGSKASKMTLNTIEQIKPALKLKKQHIALKSTNLTDLRPEQIYEQEQQTFIRPKLKKRKTSENSSQLESSLPSPKKLQKMLKKPSINELSTNQLSISKPKPSPQGFITQINGITVILYRRHTQQQQGKFLILKSQKEQTFITQTLFTNNLNLNWKNKFYRFSSSQIQISIFQKTGRLEQQQNKCLGKIVLNFIDLMKAIKQNFYRQEIYSQGKPIGTIIILYDILMESQPFKLDRRRNVSQMKRKTTLERTMPQKAVNRAQYTRELISQQYQRLPIKSTDGQRKIRKRARTLQNSHRSTLLPTIQSPSRKNRLYEGGKNIKIGRAQRFLNSNMTQVIGQL